MAYLDGGFHALATGRGFSGGHNRESRWGAHVRTTTTGLSVLHATASPFHIMRAVERTNAKLSACVRTCTDNGQRSEGGVPEQAGVDRAYMPDSETSQLCQFVAQHRVAVDRECRRGRDRRD